MNISKAGISFIREVEGSESHVYKDVAGLPTIGVGHLLTQDELANGKINIGYQTVKYANGLDSQQINILLDQDLDRFEKAVNEKVKVPLCQNEFDALVSFAFNVGVGAFSSSTLLRILNKNNKHGVPDQLRRWVYSGGKKVNGLINRREKEITLFSTHYKNIDDIQKPRTRVFETNDSDAYVTEKKSSNYKSVMLIGNWVEK